MAHKRFFRFSDSSFVPQELCHSVVVIGNFDGIHLGHQAVLQQALKEAKSRQCPAIVLTFEPHPRSYFKPDEPVCRLTSADEKAKIFALLGFDAVVEQPFDTKFCSLTAHNFIENILKKDLSARCVIAGYDFHFGKGRTGTPQFLMEEGIKGGFDVILVDQFKDDQFETISSSRIRIMLTQGHVEDAAKLLGYHYTVSGDVIHGEKLGRTLGFPTANIEVSEKIGLKYGVYAVRLRRQNGQIFDGVASFGRRPTITETGKPLLETYVFDFSDNLYGENIAISFFVYLRSEEKFDSLDSLVEQMKKDEQNARLFLSQAKPLSSLDRHFTFEKSR